MTVNGDIFSISSVEKKSPKSSSSSSSSSSSGCIRTRHIVVLLCVLSNAISYTMRTNLSMTIVAMVKESANQTHSDTCLVNNDNSSFVVSTFKSNAKTNLNQNDDELFDWSESLQGTIIGALYYGYIITMTFGGQLAEYFGTKRLILISIMASSVCTLLIPVCAHTHPYLLITVRVVTGMALALITPAMYTILPQWVPTSEMGMAIGLMHSSGNLGAVLTMPICAFLSEYGFAGGWPSVFYVFGTTGLLFLLPWCYFVYDTPDRHPRISEAEQKYIAQNISTSSAKSSSKTKHKAFVPWTAILTSSKVWALTVSRFCSTWGNLFLMSKLPAYLKSVLHMPIAYNGYVNASIYISLGASILLWGYVSDYVGRKQWIHKTTSRKLFQSVGLFGGAFFMGIVPMMGCNVMVIIILINLSMITIGLITGGQNLAVVDIAPDYAGSIYAFTNTFSSLPGFLAPQFIGILLDNNSNDNQMHQWNIMFWSASAIYALGALVFIIGTNSEPEKWGIRTDDLNSIEKLTTTTAAKFEQNDATTKTIVK